VGGPGWGRPMAFVKSLVAAVELGCVVVSVMAVVEAVAVVLVMLAGQQSGLSLLHPTT
jgi:hypothetical protein